jgi:subtilisin family serine protease
MEYRPGEVIVKYKEGVTRSRVGMQTMYSQLGVQSVRRLGKMLPGMEHLTFDPSISVEETIRNLESTGVVEYAEPNYVFTVSPVTFDAITYQGGGIGDIIGIIGPILCAIQPSLPFCKDSPGGGGGQRPAINPPPAETVPPVADPELARTWGIAKTQSDKAWEITKGSKDVIVGVIDSGVDYNHEDLAFNMWRNPKVDPSMKDEVGYNFFHKDGLPYDDLYVKVPAQNGRPEREIYGHGTHCAGTIGAVGGNGIGTVGVNQRVSIMALKFMNNQGQGDFAAAVSAIDYAVAKGAKVLSNSWGGTLQKWQEGMAGAQLRPLREAIEKAEKAGVLFVAAAGNGDQLGNGLDNDDQSQVITLPASYKFDNMVVVAASDENDAITRFSNFGKTTVHLAAPGAKIFSAVPGPKEKYAEYQGTSMATPHVAGAAALVWSKNPTWNYKQVKEALLKSVDKVSDARISNNTVTGGRLNVLKALQ